MTSAVLRSAGDRIDGRGVGAAINHHLKPFLVRRTFDRCGDDVIEGSSGYARILTLSSRALPGSGSMRRSRHSLDAAIALTGSRVGPGDQLPSKTRLVRGMPQKLSC
jgi:hypothetical protein